MRLVRNLFLVICFFFLPTLVQADATDDLLNTELGAAEGAAGTSGQQELKSNGDISNDALGIPKEEPAAKENGLKTPAQQTAPAPAPKVAKPTEVPPPEPAPQPEIAPEPAKAPTQPAETSAEDLAPPPEAAPQAEPPPQADIAPPSAESDDKVTVADESSAPPENTETKKSNKAKPGTPYRDRRGAITGFFGFEAGTYSPVNYTPQIVSGQTYGNYYSSSLPNIELVFGAKFNFFLGSIGLQFDGGYFGATAGDGSTLTVYPITIGGIYSMDSIFKEPYVVPYVVLGAYQDLYKEANGGLSVSGHTSVAPFYSVGLMFQLDALDTETHETGYKDFGLENTFVFVEARSFLASNDGPFDFSTPLQVSGGLRFEF